MDLRLARPEDAFSVAALVLAADREDGTPTRAGFLDEFTNAWLPDLERRPTWIAVAPKGGCAGLVLTSLQTRLPSLQRATTSWMHVSLVFVRPELRGQGIAEAMLRAMLAWGDEHGVERYQLNAEPKARSLYERVGFDSPADRSMELRRPEHRG